MDKIIGEDAPPLTSVHKDEFRATAKILAPDWTDEEFEKEWLVFVEKRNEYYRNFILN